MKRCIRGALISIPLALGATVGITFSATSAPPTSAALSAAAAGYERGPAPTEQSVLSAQGPFSYSTAAVPDSASSAFGTATVYYPNDTSQGTFGGVAVVPGYTSIESHIAWLGPRLASHGFVVITLNTNSRYDQPAARGQALLGALDYLTRSSPTAVRTRLDPQRLSVMGHSMGGGGALTAVRSRPSLKAAVPLAPWHSTKTWSTVTPATMIIGGSADTVAPVGQHSERFYTSLTSARERAYAEIAGANHSGSFLFEDHPVIGKFTVSWLKRFVDEDTRYDRFLCPAPAGQALTEYRASCPNG